MRYGSVCSGIEAASVAWESLGWTAAWYSEIEPFPCAVLAHHYPNVPNFGDMTKFKEWKLDDTTAIDVLVGGTPCQSFSVAGLRKGLDDPRGNLMLTYLAIANKYRPKWLVWENVPGVLSSNGGNDFASFLRGLGELGYGFAYRVLDAQYFGVAQRRRRVFVVGCLGNWRSAAAVLFERHSLSGHPAPSRKARQEIAGTIGARTGRSIGAQDAACGHMIPVADPAYCLETTCNDYSRADGFNMIATPIALAENTIGRQPLNGGNGDGFTVGGPMYTLNATGVHGVAQPTAYAFEPGITKREGNESRFVEEMSPTLRSGMGDNQVGVIQLMAVRRLTPIECEALQGFPKNYTNIPWRKKEESPDGPRYKALGNSMAVPVMHWIGKRIADAP